MLGKLPRHGDVAHYKSDIRQAHGIIVVNFVRQFTQHAVGPEVSSFWAEDEGIKNETLLNKCGNGTHQNSHHGPEQVLAQVVYVVKETHFFGILVV